jgi:hypothetical protein
VEVMRIDITEPMNNFLRDPGGRSPQANVKKGSRGTA